jgi:hypothetical protein
VIPVKTSRQRLFPQAAAFLTLIDEIVPTALHHRYLFITDEAFDLLLNSGKLNAAQVNQIVVLDNLEKSHLAAVTALIRTKRWADAVCVMADAENFLGFASAMRGLLESAGDIIDGLRNIPSTIAENRHSITSALAGREDDAFIQCQSWEKELDHFVHAGWTGRKNRDNPALTARPNLDYVKQLECEIPRVDSLYHRLCAITHPSRASIDWLYELNPDGEGRMGLSIAGDGTRIAALTNEFPEALDGALMMSCNPALLILRVLHRFDVHPKLPALKRYGFGTSPLGRKLERLLRT